MDYLVVKYLHVLSSTVLFGTGVGSAFYLLATTLTRDVRSIATVARLVVWADWLFTGTTAVLQPLTGLWMARRLQLPPSTPWLEASIVAYAAAMGCWLPVVWLQMRLRDLAAEAVRSGTPLPRRYWVLFAWWVALGVPALVLFLAVFWLMIAKPAWA